MASPPAAQTKYEESSFIHSNPVTAEDTFPGVAEDIGELITINPVVIINDTAISSVFELESEHGINLSEAPGEQNTPIINRVKGIGLILIAILSSVAQGALTKYLKDIPTGELIMTTGTYSLLLTCLLVTFNGISVTNFPLKKLVFVRVMFNVVVALSKIWSFQNLPLGDATALIFTSPLFACILGRIFLKEKLTPPHLIAMVCGIFGIFMIAKPTFLFPGEAENAAPWYYNLVPILGAVGMGSAYTAQRKIGSAVNCVTISVYMLIAGNVAGLGFQTISGDPYISPVCFTPRFMMLTLSFLSIINALSLNKGMSYEKVATVSLMRNLDTVLAFLVQLVVFSERVEVLSLAGTALIIVGTLVLTLSKVFNVSCGVSI